MTQLNKLNCKFKSEHIYNTGFDGAWSKAGKDAQLKKYTQSRVYPKDLFHNLAYFNLI